MEVYSPVSSAKRYSPDFTQLTPGHGMDLSIYKPPQLPRSIQVSCHFRHTELFKHTTLDCPARYPLTPGLRESTCGQSALPTSTMSEHNSAQPGIKPAISHMLCTLPLSHDASQHIHLSYSLGPVTMVTSILLNL